MDPTGIRVPQVKNGVEGFMLVTHFHLMPSLRMGGAVPHLFLHAFMTQNRTALLLLRVYMTHVSSLLLSLFEYFESYR